MNVNLLLSYDSLVQDFDVVIKNIRIVRLNRHNGFVVSSIPDLKPTDFSLSAKKYGPNKINFTP